MIYSYYSKGDTDGLKNFTKLTIRCAGFTIALLVALVSIFAPQLLTLWIGEEYVTLAPLVCLIVMPVLFQSQASCISPINVAYRKVRIPALANISVGLLNVTLCLTLPFVFNIGVYGIACATLISTIVINFFVSTLYNAYLIGAPRFTFMKSMLSGVLACGILLVIGNIYTSIVTVNTLGMLIFSGIFISVSYGLIVIKCFFNKKERSLIRICLPSFLQRLIPQWIL